MVGIPFRDRTLRKATTLFGSFGVDNMLIACKEHGQEQEDLVQQVTLKSPGAEPCPRKQFRLIECGVAYDSTNYSSL